MGNVGRAVEDPVDAMANISSNNTAVLGLGVLLNGISKLTEESSWLDQLDSLLQALTGGFGNTDGIGVRLRLITNIVGLVEISVEALVVESNVKVYNVTVQQDALVGNTVANNLVY